GQAVRSARAGTPGWEWGGATVRPPPAERTDPRYRGSPVASAKAGCRWRVAAGSRGRRAEGRARGLAGGDEANDAAGWSTAKPAARAPPPFRTSPPGRSRQQSFGGWPLRFGRVT